MSKQRFRDVKKGKSSKMDLSSKKEPLSKNKILKDQYYATAGLKIKAFLTDSFMLVMPIMYIVFYLIMGGREDFSEHKTLGWLYILIPLIFIQTIFMFKSSQTPGYRAYRIKIIDNLTGEKPSLFKIFFRNILAVLSATSVVGWIMMFFRKHSKSLHDFLSGTSVVIKHEAK